MRFVGYFALSTIILIIMTQVAESVINKPGKPIASNITKPKPNINVSKPIRTLPNISKPSTPKAVQTMVPAPIITATPIPEIEENNSPVDPEGEEFAEIAIGSDDDEEVEETEEDSKEVVPIKKTKTRTKSNAIERLLNNPTVKTLIKGSTMAGGGLIGTVFTILIMFKLIKSI